MTNNIFAHVVHTELMVSISGENISIYYFLKSILYIVLIMKTIYFGLELGKRNEIWRISISILPSYRILSKSFENLFSQNNITNKQSFIRFKTA